MGPGDPTRRLGGSAEPPPLEPGDTLGGWQVVRHLATGGFGTVYEARHAGGARGALKLLHADLCQSAEMTARLVREAELIAALRHPSVIELLAAGVDERGRPYLVTELLRGRDLGALIAARGRLPAAEVVALLAPLVDALAAVHARGIVHRDLKASNVFVTDDEPARVVLLDFGIAKVLDSAASALTTSRVALGTPSSMAPEQIRGEPVDARTDVYGLGALAYHLLTGRLPFDDASRTVSQHLHLHAARPRPSAAAPVEPRLDPVIVRAMAINPAARPASAPDFLAELEVALAPAAVAVPARRALGHGALVVVGAATDDDAAADDLDRLIPLAERLLADAGFALARDLGDRALFVATGASDAQAVLAGRRALGELDRRPGRDPRVTIALVLHRAELDEVDGRPRGGPLLDVAAWAPATPPPGLSATAALADALVPR